MAGPESKRGKDARIETREAFSIHKVWTEHPLNSAFESTMHPCVAPHAMTNMDGKKVDAGKPTFENQCAVRLGVALKRAGLQLPQIRSLATCGVHPPEEMHTIRAFELANALAQVKIPGMRPVRKITSPQDIQKFFSELPTSPGLIYIRGYWRRTGETGVNGDHIDVWNGYRTAVKPLVQSFTTVGMLPNYAQAREVWFWAAE